MSDFDRRQFLKGLLGQLVRATGTVVVASAAVSSVQARGERPAGNDAPADSLQARADRLAATCPGAGAQGEQAVAFLNGAFRNTPLGAFRNTPVGGFRNHLLGGFQNTPLGAFRNTPLGAFGNGGWPNGGWGGFNNGGWPNVGWRNWW